MALRRRIQSRWSSSAPGRESSRSASWRTIAVPLLLASVMLAGCFFSPREPEEPNFGGGCEFEFRLQDNFQVVIDNLEGALGCGVDAEYLQAIGDDFLYIPSLKLRAEYPGAWDSPWAKDDEANFIRNLFQVSEFDADLQVVTISGPDEGTDVVTMTTRYSLLDTVLFTQYKGLADFEFQKVDELWVLTGWADQDGQDDDLPFGDLRGSQR